MNNSILVDDRIAFRSQSAAQSHIGVELAALVEIHDAQPRRSINLSRGRSQLPTQQPEQGRFATAIRPYQPYPQPSGEDEVEVLKQRTTVDFILDILQFIHPLGLPIAAVQIHR